MYDTYSIRRSWLYSIIVSLLSLPDSSVHDDAGYRLTGNTLGSAGSTSLDLASAESDCKVGNVGGLGLAGTVRGHDTPVVGLRELDTDCQMICLMR